MKASPLMQHIGIALALSCVAIISQFIFTGLLNSQFTLSLIVFLYLSYLVSQSHLAAGRITLLFIDLSALLICLFTGISLGDMLVVYLAMIWLNRCLLCYSSILAVLADLGLCLFTASIVYCLYLYNYSLNSIVWCFLLLQALHSLISGIKKPTKARSSGDDFEQALQTAEGALQRLLNQQ